MPGPKLVQARTVTWWKVSPSTESEAIVTQALGTSDLTAPVFVAIQRMFCRRATFVPQTANVTGTTTTVKLRNLTQSVDITQALSLTGDSANVALPFVMNGQATGGSDFNLLLKPNDVVAYVYAHGTATVGPGFAVINLEVAVSGKYS